jgi:hypothetical protein
MRRVCWKKLSGWEGSGDFGSGGGYPDQHARRWRLGDTGRGGSGVIAGNGSETA